MVFVSTDARGLVNGTIIFSYVQKCNWNTTNKIINDFTGRPFYVNITKDSKDIVNLAGSQVVVKYWFNFK